MDVCQQLLTSINLPTETDNKKDVVVYKIATASVQREIRLWSFRFCPVDPTKAAALAKEKNLGAAVPGTVPQTLAAVTTGGANEGDAGSQEVAKELAVDFLANLTGHPFTTNVVRFAPSGLF